MDKDELREQEHLRWLYRSRNWTQSKGKCTEEWIDPIPYFERLVSRGFARRYEYATPRTGELHIGYEITEEGTLAANPNHWADMRAALSGLPRLDEKE